ncbi:MAG: hypothetical protein AB2L24_11085 [Mangrovibacterium sp.]|jgi:hypothetical protein
MKKIILLSLFVIAAFVRGNAQDYNTGIGLRAGFFSGLTVKHFINQSHAIEGILSSRWEGIDLSGMYEIHNLAFNVPGLNWYYGFGAHIGFWDGNNGNWNDGDDHSVVGISGILGIEYSFSNAPINIGIDWKPVLNVIGDSDFWADGGAISIRYIF